MDTRFGGRVEMTARVAPTEAPSPRPLPVAEGKGEGRPLLASGLYVLLLRLKAARRLKVGRLGSLDFRPGWYTYVGSAQRNLLARLRRHARRQKALHWHIDRLTQVATVVGAWLVPAYTRGECGLAAALARGGEVVAGFGASDCRCAGHLVRFARRSGVAEAVRSAARSVAVGESEVPARAWWMEPTGWE